MANSGVPPTPEPTGPAHRLELNDRGPCWPVHLESIEGNRNILGTSGHHMWGLCGESQREQLHGPLRSQNLPAHKARSEHGCRPWEQLIVGRTLG